ncbi:MAG: hypothetical protein M9894_28675 [Planctomycetes bacterium]|nr:hypothetical protein [Planctomycetota bacterium]
MSDARLRDLERRWRETGDPDDGAVWLRARLRAGDLDRDRLDLAAYCGHPAAQRLSDRRPPPGDAWDWGEGLVLAEVAPLNPPQASTGRRIRAQTTSWAALGFAREVCARACVAAGEVVLDLARRPEAVEGLDAARRWLVSRSQAERARASAAEDRLEDLLRSRRDAGEDDRDEDDPARAALDACRLAAGAAAVGGSDLRAAARTLDAAAGARGAPAAVLDAVAAVLTRWALGEGVDQ